MGRIHSKTALLGSITLLLSSFSGSAAVLDDIGVSPLRVERPTLTGSGVNVAQVEGSYLVQGGFQVDPADVSQPASKFRWISGNGTATTFPNAVGSESDHANGVGGIFFGPSGVAQGVNQIDNYEAGHFYYSMMDAIVPPSIPARVVNQSFVFSNLTGSQQDAVNQNYDDYAATRNVLFVSGLGNGGAVSPAGTAYNGIGVGVINGSSSVGPTPDGRCKPDITAPGGATSFSTPYVSGAAALLIQAGKETANTNAATDIRTLKALLLNGAVKPSGWTNSASAPLDLRYGSGILNIYNSYKQLTAGKCSFVEATSHSANSAHLPGASLNNLSRVGWDFSGITNLGTGPNVTDRVHHYYFTVPTNGSSHAFTATLAWNRAANSTGINNLNLFLYNTAGSLVTSSTSAVDNVEHLFVPQLPPGRYDLQVWKSATLLSTVENYGLAFECVATTIQIARTGSNATLSWPSYPNGFVLESASDLDAPVSWSGVAGTPVLTNQTYQLLVATNAPTQFYRLRRP